jgi:hypothetical protein
VVNAEGFTHIMEIRWVVMPHACVDSALTPLTTLHTRQSCIKMLLPWVRSDHGLMAGLSLDQAGGSIRAADCDPFLQTSLLPCDRLCEAARSVGMTRGLASSIKTRATSVYLCHYSLGMTVHSFPATKPQHLQESASVIPVEGPYI